MAPSNLPSMKFLLAPRAFIMALALIGWMAAPAMAAPSVLSTDPEAGAEMHEPPAAVSVEFSEPLQSTSGIKVIDECGDKVSTGNGTVGGSAMNELRVEISEAPHHGTYTVRYVATGVTGTTSDSFTFFVHGGSGCDGGADGSGGPNGGGHNGHGGDGDGDGGGNGGDGDGGGGAGKHDGHGDGSGDGSGGAGDNGGMSGDHSGMTHTGGDRSRSSGRHGDMDMGNAETKRNHNKKNHDRHAGGGGQNPTIAAGDTGMPSDVPTGGTVVIALALAVALGLLGGWVLRVSTPN